MEYFERNWTDQKGRTVLIHEMSDKWLNNLKKWLRSNKPDSIQLKWVKEEMKRRRNKRKNIKQW